MLRIGIFGLGAIGHLMAAQFLEKSGLRLYYFNRSARPFFCFHGLDSSAWSFAIHCYTAPIRVKLDWLLICLKEHQYESAAPWFRQLIQPATKIVVIRNGLNLQTPLLPYTSSDRILPTQINGPVQRLETGYYKQLGPARLLLAEHPLAPAFQSLLADAKMEVEIYPDFKTISWEKLCESAALGAITCLSGETVRIFKERQILELYRKLLAECIEVARADGAVIPPSYKEALIQKLASYPANKGSSMLSDRQAGKPIELGAKNGLISTIGRSYGVRTPLNDLFVRLLSVVNKPPKNGLHPTNEASSAE